MPTRGESRCAPAHTEFAQVARRAFGFIARHRLCEKGIFQNQKGVVTSLLSKQEFYALQSENFVKENFNGSLPAFLAAFSSRQNLTDRDVALLRRMVEEYEEE